MTMAANTEADPFSLLKNLRRKANSDSGSSNSDNQSDNSALVSFSNASFGFNFEGDANRSSSEQNENSSDSDGGSRPMVSNVPTESASISYSYATNSVRPDKTKSSVSSLTSSANSL